MVPTYGTITSVPSSAACHDPFGTFPQLNLTMQENTEGFTYYALHEQLTAKSAELAVASQRGKLPGQLAARRPTSRTGATCFKRPSSRHEHMPAMHACAR